MVQSTTTQPKKKMSKLEKRNTLIAYSFLAPNFLGFILFTLVPVIFSIGLSFMNWGGGASITWAGLDNFRFIFKDFSFTKSNLGISLRNNMYYTLATVPLTIACSLGLAIVLNKAVKGAKFFRAVFFFPYVASLVAICVCWNFMLMKDGPVNQMIMALGINFNKSWTADSTMAMWAIILVSVWRSMGYYMVICLAALQGVPRELYEAATVDGANKWQQFRNVTLPQIKPTTFFCTIMLVIGSFKIYDTVAIMTNGGPGRATKMLVTYIYDVAFNNIKYGQASAIAMVLLVIVLIVTIIQFANEKKFAND